MVQQTLTSLSLPYPGRADRLVRVYVPAHEAGESFPVVYMTDGQNLFDKESSGYGCWYTREAVQDEQAASGRSAVIVGIHNLDPWRTCELTPASIGAVQISKEEIADFHPAGDVFDRFLTETVMPAVEARFPVRTGRGSTAFCGSSMGGLFAFYTALSHPDLFSAAGVFSPAFMLFRPEDLHRWAKERLQGPLPWLHFFSGGADELEKTILACTKQTYAFLETCYPAQLLRLDLRPDQRHHETAWEPMFRLFLREFLARQADMKHS